MTTSILTVTLLLFFLTGIAPAQNTPFRTAITFRPGLEVHVAPEKQAYVQNAAIHLRVEFRNEGATSIRVGRQVGSSTEAPFRLSARIEDSQGRLIHDPLQDRPELPCVDLRESDVQHPTLWVELAPGSTYSTTLDLAANTLKNAHPGLYKIQGHYRSYGVLTGGHCMNFPGNAAPKNSIDGSTGTEWKGEVDTNTVWIKVLSPSEVPQ
jgi:hypothetical protein